MHMGRRFAASTTSLGVTGKSDGSGCGGTWMLRLRMILMAAATPATALGQQVPLLGFGGHCCRRVELRGDGVRGGCRDLARV